jgi:hypothetical protein
VSEQRWTKRPPIEAGWYWWRESLAFHARCVWVWRASVAPLTYYVADRPGFTQPVQNQGGQWYGPLQEPGGDAVD